MGIPEHATLSSSSCGIWYIPAGGNRIWTSAYPCDFWKVNQSCTHHWKDDGEAWPGLEPNWPTSRDSGSLVKRWCTSFGLDQKASLAHFERNCLPTLIGFFFLVSGSTDLVSSAIYALLFRHYFLCFLPFHCTVSTSPSLFDQVYCPHQASKLWRTMFEFWRPS